MEGREDKRRQPNVNSKQERKKKEKTTGVAWQTKAKRGRGPRRGGQCRKMIDRADDGDDGANGPLAGWSIDNRKEKRFFDCWLVDMPFDRGIGCGTNQRAEAVCCHGSENSHVALSMTMMMMLLLLLGYVATRNLRRPTRVSSFSVRLFLIASPKICRWYFSGVIVVCCLLLLVCVISEMDASFQLLLPCYPVFLFAVWGGSCG